MHIPKANNKYYRSMHTLAYNAANCNTMLKFMLQAQSVSNAYVASAFMHTDFTHWFSIAREPCNSKIIKAFNRHKQYKIAHKLKKYYILVDIKDKNQWEINCYMVPRVLLGH